MPRYHRGHSISLTNIVSSLPVPSAFFARSKTWFLTAGEMASALDRVQHRFLTERRQSAASSISLPAISGMDGEIVTPLGLGMRDIMIEEVTKVKW